MKREPPLTLEGPRSVRPEEFSSVLDMVNEAFRGRPGASIAEEYPSVFDPANTAHLRILLCEGDIVSHAAFVSRWACLLGCVVPVACVGFVCTREDHRNRGLASFILKSGMEEMERSGMDLVHILGTRSLYTRLGATRCGALRRCVVPFRENPSPVQIRLQQAGPAHAKIVTALHSVEVPRYFRSVDETRSLLCGATARGCKVFLMEGPDGPLAYVALTQPRSTDGQSLAVVQEFAGSRQAIASCVPLLLTALGLPEIAFDVSQEDRVFQRLLSEIGGQLQQEGHTVGTVKILNLPRLMERLTPGLSERMAGAIAHLGIERKGKWVALRWGHHWLSLDAPSQAAELVFGAPEGQPTIPLPNDDLGRHLKTLFPIPFVPPGLDDL